MFKGIHQVLQKDKIGDSPRHPDVLPVQTAAQLLASEKRQTYIKEMRALLNLPAKLFDLLYLSVVQQFAELTQLLPESRFGIFNDEGGFIDHGMERAVRALGLCLSYHFPQEKNLYAISARDSLWVYAVFTSALLFDVGMLAVKYRISLCHKDSSVIREWLPYTGSMVQQSKFYKYEFVKENRDNLRRLVTPIIARQLLITGSVEDNPSTGIETSGFNWIASDAEILEAWLMLLGTEERPISSFMTLIPIAESLVVHDYLKTRKAHVGTNPNLFAQQQEDQLATTAAGEVFLEWLRENLANGTLRVNQEDSQVHIAAEGVLLNMELFQMFSKSHPIYQMPNSVAQQFQQFMELYLTPIGEVGQRYVQVRGMATVAMDRFLLINNVYLLFALGQIPEINPAIIKLPRSAAEPTISKEKLQSLYGHLLHR